MIKLPVLSIGVNVC